MDKILSLNTIKNVFSALGAKTSDSNYAVALLDKTSAEPKGMMDFANLASVLGGTFSFSNAIGGRLCPILRIDNGTALDKFEGIGYYDETGQHSSLPSYTGLVISVKCGKILNNSTSEGRMQLLFSFVADGGGTSFSFTKKYRYYNDGAWSSWTDM